MTAVLETDDLGKQYGRRWALHECSLTIPDGERRSRSVLECASPLALLRGLPCDARATANPYASSPHGRSILIL